MKRPAVAGLLAHLCACSILYNPNNVPDERIDASVNPGEDGGLDSAFDAPFDGLVDAPADAAIDANPAALMITSVTSSTLVEGTGTGSRPALVIVAVSALTTDSPTITLDPIMDGGASRMATVIASRVSTDRTKIALALQLPVLTTVGEGATKPLHVTVTQPGGTASTDLTITGLDELEPSVATLDTSTLRAQYSRAIFATPVHFTGAPPALVRVTSDITISAAVDVDGIGRIAGAHGCDGGLAATAGGCGSSGGGGGNSGVGGSAGGGGGFGATASPGMGNTPGGAGVASGDDMLISLTTNVGAAGNRGNGGGGGGGATLGGGGAGGGGGGVLELTAEGSITVNAAGRARANGGNGGAGGGLGGGNGGGGSGGAIVIRSGAGISAPAGWVSAVAGTGAGSSNKGGNGSIGRVRIDATTSPAGMVTGPIAMRGAVWAATTPTLATTATPALSIVGDIGRTYGLTINDVAQTPVMVGGGGTGAVSATLATGTNRLCVLASVAATIGNQESVRCVEIVYLP